MGYFGKSILASDTSMDAECHIYKFFDVKQYDYDDVNSDYDSDHHLTKELIESRLSEFFEYLTKDIKINIEEAQTVCHQLLSKGVDLTDDRIDKFINCFKDDAWGKLDIERKYYMDYAISKLEEYKKDKRPISIAIDYDFEKYFIQSKHRVGKLPSVSEVKSLIEDATGIKVVSAFIDTSGFNLCVVMSKDEFDSLLEKYESFNGKIFGVKIIVPCQDNSTL